MVESDQKTSCSAATEEAFRKRKAFLFARRPMPNSEDGTGDVPKTKADVIREAIKIFETKFKNESLKITASEYIRLLELLQQVDEVKPREIRIKWVQPSEMTESNTEE
jgi:hypothetical protein